MMTLPVREMVLYKHGVGFFVREGEVDGQNLTLTFRHDEINDVLKSLAVFDRSGGQVLGIHYQTPMNQSERLANTSIRLSDRASLRDLLRDLRGRRATLEFETTLGGVERATGRVIGIDQSELNSGGYETPALMMTDPLQSARVAVLLDDGQMRVFLFTALRSIAIHDQQAGHDLLYFLDTSAGEDARRAVTVRLSEGQHNVVIYYVAPSPTWRVSYRLVAESDEGGKTGKALLQGWGLFDNRLDEDLDAVRVTLVAGQPISFIYDLYASRIPVRPKVQDEARVAPKPVEYREARRKERAAPAPRGAAMLAMASAPADFEEYAYDADEAPEPMAMGQIAASTAVIAQGKESGETFQYAVTTPVTVKRGESALVPIIGSEIQYERELLYNAAKLPDHPVAALRFENITGLTLERGPVTLVEDGDYKGEAIIPFTKDGSQVYVPYAVELGVKVVETSRNSRELVGLRIEDAFLVYEEYEIHGTTYKIENTTNRNLVVTIEAPITPQYELFDTDAPTAETLTERRWQVSITARETTSFTRRERMRTYRREEVKRLDYIRLQQLFQKNLLSDLLYTRLNELLDKLALVQKMELRQKQLAGERDALYKQQEQLRANLGALHTAGKEAILRERLLNQLEAAQDKIDAIDAQIEQAKQESINANAAVETIIAGLANS